MQAVEDALAQVGSWQFAGRSFCQAAEDALAQDLGEMWVQHIPWGWIALCCGTTPVLQHMCMHVTSTNSIIPFDFMLAS